MCVVVACEYFAESRQSRCHRDGIGVVGTAVEHLVLRDEIHHGFRCAESCQRQASANRFGQADHVRLQAEVFRSATPAEFRTSLTSSKISNAPFWSQSFRSPSRKPGSGIHKPTFIMIGSRIMAAISPGYCWNRYATESRSLKLATRTLARLAFGTPRPPGTELGALKSP